MLNYHHRLNHRMKHQLKCKLVIQLTSTTMVNSIIISSVIWIENFRLRTKRSTKLHNSHLVSIYIFLFVHGFLGRGLDSHYESHRTSLFPLDLLFMKFLEININRPSASWYFWWLVLEHQLPVWALSLEPGQKSSWFLIELLGSFSIIFENVGRNWVTWNFWISEDKKSLYWYLFNLNPS